MHTCILSLSDTRFHVDFLITMQDLHQLVWCTALFKLRIIANYTKPELKYHMRQKKKKKMKERKMQDTITVGLFVAVPIPKMKLLQPKLFKCWRQLIDCFASSCNIFAIIIYTISWFQLYDQVIITCLMMTRRMKNLHLINSNSWNRRLRLKEKLDLWRYSICLQKIFLENISW